MVRALSGAGMIALALICLWTGGLVFTLLVGLAAAAMAAEWAGLMRAEGWRTGLIVAVVIAILLFAALGPGEDKAAHGRDLGYALLGGAVLVGLLTRRTRLGLGVLYVGVPALALIYLRGHDGIALTLWTLAIVWATDIGAYFAGRAIGGPKLAPRLSPNKTWAGLGGGMAGALVVGAAIALSAGLSLRLILFAPLLAVLAQMGDLLESWLKRRAGVKDSGRLLPGHGGVLDRLDGLVPVATVVAVLSIGKLI